MARRFYVPPGLIQSEIVLLDSATGHHIRDVLRMRINDSITLFDGLGGEYHGRIVEMNRKAIRVEITSFHQDSTVSTAPSVVLIQAIPRHGRIEWILEKATELGVNCIIPTHTERTVRRLSDKSEAAVRRVHIRWTRIVQSAAAQCGRSDVPVVENVVDFSEALKRTKICTCRFIATCSCESDPIATWSTEILQAQSTAVAIGPEGDFTPEEVELAMAVGFKAISLGKNVLRTETAALAVLSYLHFIRS